MGYHIVSKHKILELFYFRKIGIAQIALLKCIFTFIQSFIINTILQKNCFSRNVCQIVLLPVFKFCITSSNVPGANHLTNSVAMTTFLNTVNIMQNHIEEDLIIIGLRIYILNYCYFNIIRAVIANRKVIPTLGQESWPIDVNQVVDRV